MTAPGTPGSPGTPAPPGSPPPSDAFPVGPATEPAIRLVMMPKDTNAQGTIFGGVILSLIDQAAFVEALRQSHRKFVTVAMDAVEFHKPVYMGDVVSLHAQTVRIGRTSIRVHVDVTALRRDTGDRVHVTEADVTLVAVDDREHPVPIREG